MSSIEEGGKRIHSPFRESGTDKIGNILLLSVWLPDDWRCTGGGGGGGGGFILKCV